jgi:hypothetical protein
MMSRWLVHLAVWGVSWGLGYDDTARLIAGSPDLVADAGGPPTPVATSLGAGLVRVWMCGLATLLVGFVYSYFWTAATIIYFLLRKSVDGNEFDEVFAEQDHEPDELLPLVGAAAMGQVDQIAPETAAPGPTNDAPPVDLTP